MLRVVGFLLSLLRGKGRIVTELFEFPKGTSSQFDKFSIFLHHSIYFVNSVRERKLKRRFTIHRVGEVQAKNGKIYFWELPPLTSPLRDRIVSNPWVVENRGATPPPLPAQVSHDCGRRACAVDLR